MAHTAPAEPPAVRAGLTAAVIDATDEARPTHPSLGRAHWHSSDQSGRLRAGVFGVNDGLVSNLSLVMGVAGAGPGVSVILLSGVAGLLAGAFSMAAGEYISVRTQRERYEHLPGVERRELADDPAEEAASLRPSTLPRASRRTMRSASPST
jgi:hypothetical protein